MLDNHINYPPVESNPAIKAVMTISGEMNLDNDLPVQLSGVESGQVIMASIPTLVRVFAHRINASAETRSRISTPTLQEVGAQLIIDHTVEFEAERQQYAEEYNAATESKVKRIADSCGFNLLEDSCSLDVLIDTPGGHVNIAYAQVLLLQMVRLAGGRVSAYAPDFAGSGGMNVLLAAANRYVLPKTYCLLHAPRKVNPDGSLNIDKSESLFYQLAFQQYICKNAPAPQREKLLQSCRRQIFATAATQQTGQRDYDFCFLGQELAEGGLAHKCDTLSALEATFTQNTGMDCRRTDQGFSSVLFNLVHVRRMFAQRFPSMQICQEGTLLLASRRKGVPIDTREFVEANAVVSRINNLGMCNPTVSDIVRSY